MSINTIFFLLPHPPCVSAVELLHLLLCRICIFCGERNEAFTEEGLDIHYWKSCPMLKRCANCKQVCDTVVQN